MHKDWIDASDQFTKDGIMKLRLGQTLGFVQPDGRRIDYKIVRLNRKSGIVMMKPINLMTVDEFNGQTGSEL